MASTYTTGFGIEKIGTGEQAGAWGTTTNHNADILDRIASYTAVALTGTTHTLTVREASPGSGTENLQDGMYRVIKFTGALGANNTVTIAPNTSPAWFIIENATTDSGSSGPYSVILTQGSGANVTVQNGKNAIIYCDGAGAGAVVYDALADLQVGTLEVTGAAAIDGALTAAAISATTLTISGIASIDDTTDTTSGTTGSIHTDGGLGVAKNLFVATNATVSGTTLMTGVTTHGGNVVSDTDSTDDLGTTGVRWANLFVDGITATDQITATGFTGTLDGILGSGTPAAATVTTLNASDQVAVSGSGNRSMSITSTDGIASMEIGAAAGNAAFIDFKTPSGDDYDLRIGSLAGGSGGAIDIAGGTFSINGTGESMATFADDGAVTLYHNNVAKIATASTGVTITGEATATGFTGTLDGILGSGTPAAATVTTLTASGVTTVQAGTALLPSIVPTGDTNTGVWFPAADTVAASTAGSERMRIDSSGNVGIGTSSLNSKLNVNGRVFAAGSVTSNNGDTAFGAGGSRAFMDWNGSLARIGTVYGGGSGGPLAFYVNSGESARINSNGTIGIAVSEISGVQLGMKINGQTWFAVFESDDGTDQFRIASTGNVTNTNNSYGAISDIKLKENITAATPKLADLMQVKICNFNFIGDTTKQIGVIAQELETVFPGMVDDSPDPGSKNNDLGTTTKSVKYSVFVPILIKAMQEQQATIEALTARITSLEG
jgi:hypothetical protein